MAAIQEAMIVPASESVARPLGRLSARRLGAWIAVAGWASMLLMWLTGSAEVFGHEQQGIPAVMGIGLFLVGWAAMVAGMMLPSSLPTLGLIDRRQGTRADSDAPRFMLGFFLPWAVFGTAAFAGDAILHLTVAGVPWLAERPSLIAGGAAMFAGAAELLGRTPPSRLPRIRPGAGSFALGNAHAVDRIRRCWPLMLFAMAVGMGSPVWMVSLTLVMTLEFQPRASTALRLAGLVLFGLGVLVVFEPGWLPVLFGS
jgi:predicted metal-binding membrane protein